MDSVENEKLELVFISSFAPSRGLVPFHESCYALWESVWLPTLRELDGVRTLASDAFTRQDFLTALTIAGRPVGLVCFKMMDLSVPSHRRDSWFAPWPAEMLAGIAGQYPKAMVPSWLTVHPEFRRSAGYREHDLGGLLAEMISLVTLDAKADIAFGTPRKDRSVHRLVAEAGAVVLVPDVAHHGVLVDLVAFYPQRLREVRFSETALSLWDRKVDLRKPVREQEKRFYERSV